MTRETFSTEKQGISVWHKLVAVVAVCSVACTQAWAASAWAYESGTAIVGQGVAPTISKAESNARKDCENNGATGAIVDWFSSTTPGHGAVYVSDEGAGGLKLGGTLGYTKMKKAKRKAKKFCKNSGGTNCQLVDTLFDPAKSNAGKGKQRGVAFSL